MKKGANKSPAAELRRFTKERLRSDKQYRVLFDGAGDAIFIHDKQGKILAANKMACKQYGYTRPELVSMTVRQIDSPAEALHAPARINRVAKHGRLKFETVHRRKDGTPLQVEVSSRRTTWNSQAAIMSICRDITARKQTEAALHENETRFRELFNRMSSGVAVYEAIDNGGDFIFRDFNPAAEKIDRVRRQDIIGKRVSKVFPGVKAFGILEVFRQVWQTGKPEYFPQKIYRDARDAGSWRENWVFKLPAGEIVAIYNDITERKKMEDALRENEQLFYTVFHAIPDLVGLSTLQDGRFIEINRAFVDASGFSREEVVGHTSLELGVWENPEGRKRIVQLLKQDGHVLNLEVNLRRKSGEIVPALCSAEAIKINGQPCLITVTHDITAIKKAERERERLNQELSRTNQELETLIRIASHDLRSPLVNIQGFNQLLNKAYDAISRILADAPLPDETRQALAASHEKALKSMRFINAGVEKMAGLISGLLRLSRLGRAPLALQLLDMNALMQAVLESMAFQIQSAAAEVTVEALPDCRADAALINQVFSNLLDNAIKYRDPARPLRVRIWGRHPGEGRHPGMDRHPGADHLDKDEHTVYCVEDNGLGVAPEHQQKIWELFYRYNPQGNGPGEGIGLPAVQRIMERHGGTAWMESEPGQGSRFFIGLPAAAKETDL